MPPPVGSSSSRSGAMITWTVVCSILFITATIFAIYFYVAKNQAEEAASNRRKQYTDIVPEAALASSAVTELKQLKQDPDSGLNANMSVFDAAIKQRNDLAQAIAGPNANAAAAMTAAKQALSEVANELKPAGLALPTSDNLVLAFRTLADGLKAKIEQNEQLNQQLTAAKKQVADTIAQTQQQIQQMNDTVAQVRKEASDAQAQIATYRDQKDQSVQQIEASIATERQQAQQQAQEAQVQLREKDRQIEQLTRDINTLRDRLGEQRVNSQDAIIRQADGHVIRVPSATSVYIDLGQGDSITPGLTFEVYDKDQGIPRPGNAQDEEKLPAGKASIEVIRVGATSSEARVTRQQPGTVITEGDPIVNLVYDKNVKYNFMVYGNFDLDQNGQATPQDTEVIKRLITQWGGRLTDKVNIDTDFVVLGKEPELPVFTREELQDPFNAKKLADAQAELDAYQDVVKKATELRIPILNQNRFLYLIGYYGQATK